MPRQFGGSAPKCPECGKSVYAAEEVKGPAGKSWHQLCFCCKSCGKSMRGGEWKEIGGVPACHACHANKESVYGPRGIAAGQASATAGADPPAKPPEPLTELAEPPVEIAPQHEADTAVADSVASTEDHKPMSLKERMAALQASQDKDKALSKDAAPTDAKPRQSRFSSSTAPICPTCSTKVYPAEEIKGPGGKSWHALCFCCKACGKSMRGGQWRDHGGEPHCETCHSKLFGIKGVGFGNTLIDPGAKVTSEAADASASKVDSFQPKDRLGDDKEVDVASREVKTADAESKQQSKDQAMVATSATAEQSTPAAATDQSAGPAVCSPQDVTVSVPSADAPEATKKMSLKERSLAFQAAANASALKGKSFQPENQASGAKEAATGSELQNKTSAKAENNSDAAQTSEAQPCMQHANVETVDPKIAKDETKVGADNVPNEEAEIDLPSSTCNEETEKAKTEAEQVPAIAMTTQRDPEPATQAEVNAASREEVAATDACSPQDVTVSVEEASAHETGDVVAKPCSQYRLDVAGKSFGDCKCGFSKVDHETLKTEICKECPSDSTPNETSERAAQPCSNYRLDMAGKSFSDCKCGFSKAAHEALKNEICKDVPSDSMPEESSEMAAQPCSNFRLDIAGKSFGDCRCGFPKSEH